MSAEATSSPGSSASHSWVHFRQRFLPAIALCLALAAQGLLLYSTDKVQIAAILFILAANCLLIAFYDWPAAVLSPYRSLCAPYLTRPLVRPTLARIFLFILSLFLAGLSFRRFGANNLAGGFWWWFAAIILFLIATIAVPHGYSSSARNSLRAWWETVDKRVLLLLLTIMLLATFYRFYRLQAVPLEMTSDHVEKILDVQDILDGQRPIFFTRNTGREMFQFYLTAAIINLTGLPNSHLALKVGTA
ncbi:MAG: hypothetical protein ACK2UK_20740, partial [Candidatus Promineifilaceae bacterium]